MPASPTPRPFTSLRAAARHLLEDNPLVHIDDTAVLAFTKMHKQQQATEVGVVADELRTETFKPLPLRFSSLADVGIASRSALRP